MKRPVLVRCMLAGGVLVAGATWCRGQVTYVSQSRSATASAGADFAGQHDDDAQAFEAPDFAPFDVAPQAYASVWVNDEGANASSGAQQTSGLFAGRIEAAGSAGGTSEAFGEQALAQTDAQSYFQVTFVIEDDFVSASLRGHIVSDSFGQAGVQLSGPGGVVFDGFVQSQFWWQDIQESFLLTAGTYTLTIQAFADSAASGYSSEGQSGGFDLVFAVGPGDTDCNGNGIPDGVDVRGSVYAVTDAGDGLYETLDPNHTGDFWELIGEMGAGIASVSGLTEDPTTGQWYVLAYADGQQQLGTLNPDTAAVSLIGPLSASLPPDERFGDIVFAPDGTLYVAYSFAGLGVLGIVDTGTGAVTIAMLGIGYGGTYGQHALAADPATGLLYHAYDQALETIDPQTFARTILVSSGGPVWMALTFDHSGATLLGATSNREITSIDPQTGEARGVLHPYTLLGMITGMLYRPLSEDVNRDGIPDECSPPGDIDNDGDVDLSDLARLLAAFGTCDGDPAFDAAADVNADGCVTLEDLSILLSDYGAGT